jgi:AcrR family transcriptional regulator
LGAQTAVIAREAGVASGSLFTYFETKKVLFNELYLDLKADMASAALEKLPRNASLRKQLFSVWSNWMHWVSRNDHGFYAPRPDECGETSSVRFRRLMESLEIVFAKRSD